MKIRELIVCLFMTTFLNHAAAQATFIKKLLSNFRSSRASSKRIVPTCPYSKYESLNLVCLVDLGVDIGSLEWTTTDELVWDILELRSLAAPKILRTQEVHFAGIRYSAELSVAVESFGRQHNLAHLTVTMTKKQHIYWKDSATLETFGEWQESFVFNEGEVQIIENGYRFKPQKDTRHSINLNCVLSSKEKYFDMYAHG